MAWHARTRPSIQGHVETRCETLCNTGCDRVARSPTIARRDGATHSSSYDGAPARKPQRETPIMANDNKATDAEARRIVNTPSSKSPSSSSMARRCSRSPDSCCAISHDSAPTIASWLELDPRAAAASHPSPSPCVDPEHRSITVYNPCLPRSAWTNAKIRLDEPSHRRAARTSGVTRKGERLHIHARTEPLLLCTPKRPVRFHACHNVARDCTQLEPQPLPRRPQRLPTWTTATNLLPILLRPLPWD